MRKTLKRDLLNGKLTGVCAGLANYFEVDPSFVRIFFVLFSIFGAGILVYLVCLFVMPKY